jgi:hypothetical protein
MKRKLIKIKLQLTGDIRFPDICPYCHNDKPDTSMPISPEDENGNHSERMIVFAAPACTSCVYAHRERERQLSNLAFTVFLMIFTGAAAFLMHTFYSLFIIAICFFTVILFSSLKVLMTEKSAISIDSVNDSSVTFRFTSRKYFEEFFNLNKDLVIENSTNGDK